MTGNDEDSNITRKITNEGIGKNIDNMDRNRLNAVNHTASESVVPGLMEVYDALTQSSTPQSRVPPPATANGRQQAADPPPLPPSRYSRKSTDESFSGSAGSKRKYSGSSKRARKSKDDPKKSSSQNDSRWGKRFTWPDELHRDFVAAVFEVGLKHSSPSAIMEHMKQHTSVTSERVKSHLQKYRLNKTKSKNEFMKSYDRAVDNFKSNPLCIEGDHSFSCGEVAAHLTHSVQMESNDSQTSNISNREQLPPQAGQSVAQDTAGVAVLHLPLLSDDESRSPLGQTFGYLVGMFQTLSAELDMKRQIQDNNFPHIYAYNGSAQSIQQPYPSIEETAATVASMSSELGTYAAPNSLPDAVLRGISGSAVYQQPHNHQGNTQEIAHILQPVPTATSSASTCTTYPKSSAVPCPLDESPGGTAGQGRTLQAQKESRVMKEEMKSQKAFQNKMRALKQVELNKYGGQKNPPPASGQGETSAAHSAAGGSKTNGPSDNNTRNERANSTTSYDPELDVEFWQQEDITDQLFDFLVDS